MPDMKSKTLSFLSYILGLRNAYTSDTNDELLFLSHLAQDKKNIIEVGVFEGVASKIFCESMSPSGKLYLIDPYFKSLRIEELFGFSTAEFIAKRNLRNFKNSIRFVKKTSAEAASEFRGSQKADLIFIDARHDYESVLQDFELWSTCLKDDGVIAFHDSHMCRARPDLSPEIGPVKLCEEIASGLYDPWKVVDAVDSITLVAKAL